MVTRKRLDDRVRFLLERGILTQQRSVLAIVGDYGKHQVANLHSILVKSTPIERMHNQKRVLWCYKKELGFSSHKKKRLKKLKRDQLRGLATEQTDSFELFVSSTDINWCYYRDTHRVLGQTFGMLILQDFEALTPNLLARTIETVHGGGLIVFLLRTVNSLKQLYTLSMDVHARYRTAGAGDIVPRFNERFILSLGRCRNCLVCDDELNVLPLSRKVSTSLSKRPTATPTTTTMTSDPVDAELTQLKESLADTPHVGVLVNICKTLDQAQAVLTFVEACSEKTLTPTVTLTAARGRGKSAALGLALAGSISLGYSLVCLTAPEPENLQSVFEFVCRGLNALQYQPNLDYTITYNSAKGRENVKCVTSIQIHRSHRQLIHYITPDAIGQFVTAEIIAIDEAAAIPLPLVRALIKPDKICFLSSTVNGYEGTGRALSLKLIRELRNARGSRAEQVTAADQAVAEITGAKANKSEFKVHEQRWSAAAAAAGAAAGETNSGKRLREVELSTPIRYATGDAVESWLHKLLCLDCGDSSAHKLSRGAPAPSDCELYSVNRDALFSFHKLSEAFLQKVMGLYTSAHYKNSPNDLQMLSDAPAHSLFVLLGPSNTKDSDKLPDVLCVVQVALEGGIGRKAVEAQLARGHRSAGDLIPWTISQQFGDTKFANLSGARIVRIATHPSVQGMGYGSHAMDLLYRFFNGEMISISSMETEESDGDEGDDKSKADSVVSSDEDIGNASKLNGLQAESLKPRKELPPLLCSLTELDAPRLDWIGTSFGLTLPLHNFWTRRGMHMLYLRQTQNELTGEHSAIMLRALPKRTGFDESWLGSYVVDVRRRFIALLGIAFRDLDVRLAVAILESMEVAPALKKNEETSVSGSLSADELDYYMTPHDLKRLEMYGRNLCDHHLVTDILPTVCRLYFTRRFGADFNLSSVQAALLTGIGLQSRTVDDLVSKLDLPSNQVLAMFNKAVRKISIALNNVIEAREKKALLTGEKRKKAEKALERMKDVTLQTLEEDAKAAAKEAAMSMKPNVSVESLPVGVRNNPELIQYMVKGSDEQWEKALTRNSLDVSGTIQIPTVREKRRQLNQEDIVQEMTKSDIFNKQGTNDKKKSLKKRKKPN